MQTTKTKTAIVKAPAKAIKQKDCPYCKSQLTTTEKDFFPCSCSFQACGNCYEDLLHNKGLCPTCHKPFRLPRMKNMHTSKKEELQKSDIDKLNKDKKKTTTITTVVTTVSTKNGSHSHTTVVKPEPKVHFPNMSFAELTKLRIIQRNLVYVIGLAPQIAKPEVLERTEYFGQYGKISKIVVNKGNVYNATSGAGPSLSAYITFSKEIDAAIAIMAADQFTVCDRTLRTSYGTTKYCSFLLKGQTCPNPDCLYLHSCETREELLIKDENMSNREIFMDQQKLTLDFIEKHFDDVVKRSSQESSTKPVLPSLSTVQAKSKRLIDQRNKERPREKGDATHADINHSATKKAVSISKTSQKSIESPRGSLSPGKSSTNQESKNEGASENALPSHRSTSSNWSALENNQKKEDHVDHKEELEPKSASKTETDVQKSEASVSVKDSEMNEKVCNENVKGRSSINDLVDLDLLRTSSTNSLKDAKDLEENTFKDEFDKTIYERLMAPIFVRKISRFSCTQEDGTEEEDSLAPTADSTAKSSENEEFSVISKSISDFVVDKNEQNEISSDNIVSPFKIKGTGHSILCMNKGPQSESNNKSGEIKPSNNLNTTLKDHNSTQASSINGLMFDKSGKTSVGSVSSTSSLFNSNGLSDAKGMVQKGGNTSHSVNKTEHGQSGQNWENINGGPNLISKHSVNKSSEYSNMGKCNDNTRYPNITHIHTRNNQNRITTQQW